MSLFKNPNDVDNENIIRLIKKWIRDQLNISEETVITVSQISCPEPGCPDTETVIVIFKDAERRLCKIRKPLNYIRKWDIENLKNR